MNGSEKKVAKPISLILRFIITSTGKKVDLDPFEMDIRRKVALQCSYSQFNSGIDDGVFILPDLAKGHNCRVGVLFQDIGFAAVLLALKRSGYGSNVR